MELLNRVSVDDDLGLFVMRHGDGKGVEPENLGCRRWDFFFQGVGRYTHPHPTTPGCNGVAGGRDDFFTLRADGRESRCQHASDSEVRNTSVNPLSDHLHVGDVVGCPQRDHVCSERGGLGMGVVRAK